MIDKNIFMETLRSVKEIAGTSAEPMDQETAMSYFKDMELSREQEEMVYQYLMLPEEDMADDAKEAADTKEADAAGETADSVEQETYTPHFQMYLDEINEIKTVDAAGEEALYRRLLSGDTAVVELISNQWLKRVIVIAEEYKNRGYLMDDLVQEGNIGLLLGLNVLSQSSDESNAHITPAKVPGLLKAAIQDAIEQFLGEESGEDQQNETILGKVSLVHQAQEYLTREKGETPSLSELAAYTKIPVTEIDDILSLVKEAK